MGVAPEEGGFCVAMAPKIKDKHILILLNPEVDCHLPPSSTANLG